MPSIRYVKPDFPADAFVGTATYYTRYRVPYPKALLDDMLERADVTGEGRLLDLASGPGRLSLPLARAFTEVWAIDLEPEMVAAGRKEAARLGVENVKWMVGRAEELDVEPGTFELITIGEAFHRLDQRVITQQALQWLAPGNCLATAGCYGILSGTEPWQRIVAGIVDDWTADKRAREDEKERPGSGSGPEHARLVLHDAGFEEVDSHSFAQPHVWTIDSIIGNLYSTSRCSKRVLGERSEPFEAALREALLAHDASGHYHENIRCGYTLGRKPG